MTTAEAQALYLWAPVGDLWAAVYKLEGEAFDRASTGLTAAVTELQEAGLLSPVDAACPSCGGRECTGCDA